MNEVIQQGAQQLTHFPQPQRQLAPHVNAGAVTIEVERAVAEAKGQMQLAKMFPRDLNAAYAELMEACKLPALASVAFYSKPQGGSKVTGPSIRLAEEIARVYGNYEYGHRELSRVEATPTSFGRSEIEVYGWDKQTNNRSIRQITVLHVIDTKEGPKRLRDQTEVDNKIANVASKQLRGRILAMMPKWMVEAAIEECKKTLAGANEEPVSVRVRKMTQAFAKFGVTTEHLETYLGHKLDDTLVDELIDLMGVFNAIRDGAKPSEYFGEAEKEAEAENAKESLARTAQQGAQRATRKPAAAKQEQAKAEPQTEEKAPEQKAEEKPQAQTEAEQSKPVEAESKPVEAESALQDAQNQQQEVQPDEASGEQATAESEDNDYF